MPRDQQFEIPRELRQLAEENVERARKLYLQFMEGVSQAMNAWSPPSSNAAASGFNEVRERAAKFAQENADAAFSLAREVAQARDLQELVTLQTRYVQSQMKWYAQQTQEFGQLMAHAFAGAQSQPPRPSERAASKSTDETPRIQPKPGDETI
jgi:phasin